MSALGVIKLDASQANGLSFDDFVRGGFLAGLGEMGFPVFDNKDYVFAGQEMFMAYGVDAGSKYLLARGDLEYHFGSHIVWGGIETIEYGTRGAGSFDGNGSFVGGNVQLRISNLTFQNGLSADAAQNGAVHNFASAHMYGQAYDVGKINRYADQLDQYAQEFIGSAGNDVYTGTAFDDIIRGGGGDDAFDGGGGNDVVFFTGNRADYTVVQSGGNVQISLIGGTWTTTVTNVEFARFDDIYVKLSDLSEEGTGSAPYDLTLETSSISEDAAIGTTVSVIKSTDNDADDSVTYTLYKDESGLFEVVGNEVRVRRALDYETAQSHQITIRMIDKQGNIALGTVTIQVEDVDDTNAAPHSLKLSSTSVKENVAVGTTVGILSATDPDGHALTYSLLNNGGGLFAISGNRLVTARPIDYEKVQKATVRVQVSDGREATVATFTINVTDVVETITGTARSETLRGGIGADKIMGKAGHDTLFGNAGNDLLYGEAGNDVLIGGAGADKLYGGAGIDTASYATAAKGVTANMARPAGNTNDAKGDTYSSIENLKGSVHADKLTGNSANNLIDGGKGNDAIWGGSGHDKLYGGAGNDSLYGEAHNDLLYGGAGSDKLYGGAGNDSLFGGAGNDTLLGGAGADRLRGEAGNDKLRGEAGNDTLWGDAGNDLLQGDAGNDVLWGGAGKDKLYGGAGNDKLIGGLGADQLHGGAGRDTFVFTSLKDSTVGAGGRDTIFDFQGRAGDRIDLRQIDASTKAAGNQAFDFIGTDAFSRTAGELRYEKKGSTAFVYGDVNGDGKADFSIRLEKVTDLTEGYFLL